MALPDNGLFGAIAGKKSLPTNEVAPARLSERSTAVGAFILPSLLPRHSHDATASVDESGRCDGASEEALT
jgi:hypothetical protein